MKVEVARASRVNTDELRKRWANDQGVAARDVIKLCDDVNAATAFSLGREGDDDKRDFVIVARQYRLTHMVYQSNATVSGQARAASKMANEATAKAVDGDLHDWGVYVYSHQFGLCITGASLDPNQQVLAAKSRQFNAQHEALAYGWTLLLELRKDLDIAK
jgi:hypothetical protein